MICLHRIFRTNIYFVLIRYPIKQKHLNVLLREHRFENGFRIIKTQKSTNLLHILSVHVINLVSYLKGVGHLDTFRRKH